MKNRFGALLSPLLVVSVGSIVSCAYNVARANSDAEKEEKGKHSLPNSLSNETQSEIENLVRSEKVKKEEIGFSSSEVPQFGIKPYMCARYARLAAHKLTGAEYTPGDAWDFAKNNFIVQHIDSFRDLYEVQNAGKLRPGESIIVVYNPTSKYNKPERAGTHAVLYLGENINGELVFAHEWGSSQEKITVRGMNKKGLIPRQVVAPKKKVRD
ncbi:MAG: hypothetical protein Q7R56_00880 [Nanoarchaeota archaeon]|nr:hypothetical protein [Nanoarchaeota archaeon]